jgi:uncharacterized protein YjbI with pentapeptide repeats
MVGDAANRTSVTPQPDNDPLAAVVRWLRRDAATLSQTLAQRQAPKAPSRLMPQRTRGRLAIGPLADGLALGALGIALGGAAVILVATYLSTRVAIKEALQPAVTLLIGAAVTGGAYLTWRQRHEQQSAERFTKAVELLRMKDSDPGDRAAAVKALGMLATDTPGLHPDVVETLCEYIRRRSQRLGVESEDDLGEGVSIVLKSALETPIDVEAAARELGRRRPEQDRRGDRLVLRGAHLAGTDLIGSRFARADLAGARLQGARLDSAVLMFANLRGAYLQNAGLEGANLHVANLRGAYLQDANLREADLRYAVLEQADLNGAILAMANLERARLDQASLRKALLGRAFLRHAMLISAELQEANLIKAELRFARLQGANLQDANLQDANLQNANLQNANLQDANLQGANLQGANLQGARFTRRSQLETADNVDATGAIFDDES